MSDHRAESGFSGGQAGEKPPQERWLPACLDEIAPVRRWVGQCAEGAGFDPRVVRELQVAVSEALSNVVRHAYGTREGPIRVGVSVEARVFSIHVQDWGVPFSPDTWQPPDLSEPRAGGYGVLLMHLYADEITCHRLQDGSNLMLLVRTLGSPPRSLPSADPGAGETGRAGP